MLAVFISNNIWNRDEEKYFQFIVILSFKKDPKVVILSQSTIIILVQFSLVYKCTLLIYVTKVVQYNNPVKPHGWRYPRI